MNYLGFSDFLKPYASTVFQNNYPYLISNFFIALVGDIYFLAQGEYPLALWFSDSLLLYYVVPELGIYQDSNESSDSCHFRFLKFFSQNCSRFTRFAGNLYNLGLSRLVH